MRKKRKEWLLLALVLFLLSQTKVERAQVFTGFQWQPGEVVEIQAKKMELALKENYARFLGDVVIKKGESIIYCQELKLKYDPQGNITWLKAYGSVKLKEKESFASGEELEYLKSANKFWLRGVSRNSISKAEMNNSRAKLKVSGLVKSYRKRRVVDGISFEVASGEVFGLLGPNGAGKTTTFYLLVGLIQAEAGEIYLNHQRIDHLPMWERARRGITYLPQESSIFRGLTVRENLEAIAQISGLSPSEQKMLVEGLLKDFGLKHLEHQSALTLSGGERRRCEIARSLVLSPLFILLDEPFTGIDPLAISDLKELVRGLKDRGIGVVITDHNVRETLKICDRALIINQGRCLIEGTPEQLVESELAKKFYLGKEFTL